MHILFVTATRIGDAVLSTGLLAYLIDRYPTARLTIAAGPVAAPLFEAVPRLERLAVIEKRRWSAHWVPFYATVARRRWDLVVDLRGSALGWLLQAGERKVMAKGDAPRFEKMIGSVITLSLAYERLGTRPRSAPNRRFLRHAEALAA